MRTKTDPINKLGNNSLVYQYTAKSNRHYRNQLINSVIRSPPSVQNAKDYNYKWKKAFAVCCRDKRQWLNGNDAKIRIIEKSKENVKGWAAFGKKRRRHNRVNTRRGMVFKILLRKSRVQKCLKLSTKYFQQCGFLWLRHTDVNNNSFHAHSAKRVKKLIVPANQWL